MASAKQETVSNSAANPDAKNRATALFGTSPLLTGEYSDAVIRTTYQDLLNSTVQNGFGFSEGVDLNYSDSPDYTDVPEGAASPFLPNPTSPGEGNGANPTSKPAAPAHYAEATSNPGTYPGGPTVAPDEVSPSDVASKVGASGFDGLVLGKSRYTAGG